MFKRLKLLAIATLLAIAALLGAIAPLQQAAARSTTRGDDQPLLSPGYLDTRPVTILSRNITTTYTSAARFSGDASYLDTFLTIVAGAGNVTATVQNSSNGADWVTNATSTLAATTAGTPVMTRTTAYGAYYRIVVTTNSSSITPTLRVVQKP